MRNDRGHQAASPKVAADQTSPLAEFLNPNSMITPGAAGAFSMTITNTLCQQFAALHLGVTGLVVSFLFGAVVFGYGASIAARLVYYVINSLVIFTVAMGSNAIGQKASEQLANQPMSQVSAVATAPDFNLAGSESATPSGNKDEKAAKQNRPPEPPPKPKPKFFRSWL